MSVDAALLQRRNALVNAEKTRLARSAAKKAMRAHELSLAAALDLECCQSMYLGQLLEAQWNWGPSRTLGFLARVNISPLKKVESLTARQRGLVVEALR